MAIKIDTEDFRSLYDVLGKINILCASLDPKTADGEFTEKYDPFKQAKSAYVGLEYFLLKYYEECERSENEEG